jgi:hypothetical protein
MSTVSKTTSDTRKTTTIGNSKVGQTFECVVSHSPAYTKGKTYTVVKAADANHMVLIGNDGLSDPVTLLVSEFKHIKEKDNA